MKASLDQIVERASKVKLTGGLVGRVCTVLLVGSLALGAIGVASHSTLVGGGAIAAILVLVLPILWRVINFAQKNPSAAILDGAQFLRHEQLLLASKTHPEIPVNPDAQVQGRPLALPPTSLADLDKPDPPLLQPPKNPER